VQNVIAANKFFISVTYQLIIELSHKKMEIISSKRRRRRRISITAGEESEANVTCGLTAR